MSSLRTPKRLTWDPIYPAPFESLWSIFGKVIAFNNISLSDLISLICKEADEFARLRSINWHDSTWIDFKRFADLLGVAEERILMGTWSAMGIIQFPNIKYAVRTCPKCWDGGFHCVLFDITLMKLCPVHHCALTKQCVMCACATTFRPGISSAQRSKRSCSGCNLALPDREMLTRLSSTWSSDAQMEWHCHEFIQWWDAVKRAFPDRDAILAPILQAGITTPNFNYFNGWRLGQALGIKEGERLSWEFSLKRVSTCSLIIYGATVAKKSTIAATESKAQTLKKSDGTLYRSLRRHLYNRFVRPHRSCYRAILAMNDEEILSIDGRKVCPVAAAYIAWRMSIEGRAGLEQLRFTKPVGLGPEFMGPREYETLPVRSALAWSYASFFGVWYKLTRLSGVKNVRVEKCYTYDNSMLDWRRADSVETSGPMGQSLSHQRFVVLYPDPEYVLRYTMSECTRKRGKNGSMVDQKWYRPQDAFSIDPVTGAARSRNILFQVKIPSDSPSSKRFVYITV